MTNLGRSPRDSYRALLFDYDALLAKSDDECCYNLSEREVALILAQIDYIGWKTRYRPTATQIDREIIDMWKGKLAEKLMVINCGTSLIFRQNPADYCQLQQSLDGGETWETVFDYSLCAGGAGNELYILMQQSINEVNIYRTEIYDGSTTSIDPDAPTDTWDYNGATGGEAALCNAVQAYVQNQMLQYYNKLLIGIGAAAITTGILGWITGGLALVIGGVIVLVAGLAIAAVQEAINDLPAMNAIICRLVDDLNGVATTEGDFWNAVTSLTCANTNECVIRDVLIAGAYKEPNYLYFLALIGEAKREVGAGIDNCPCGDNWCRYFAFATSGDEGWSTVYPSKVAGGVFGVGVGWDSTDFLDTISNPDQATRSIGISTTLSPRTVNGVSFNFDITKGTFDLSGFCVRILINGIQVATRNNLAQPDGTSLFFAWSGSVVGANRITCEIRASKDSASPYAYSGFCRINSVTVTGVGTNPFGSDNCL
jgi:hypothetical protein